MKLFTVQFLHPSVTSFFLYNVKKDEMDRACSTHMCEAESIQSVGGKNKRKETTRKTIHRRESNIKIDLKEIGWGYRLDLSGSGYRPEVDLC
jgi:hypothetical protein